MELRKGFLELVCSLLICWLNCYTHDWVGDEHTLTSHHIRHVTLSQRLTRGAVNSENSENIASFDLVDFLHFVGMQFDEPADF